jgi:hypothetical protein
MDHAANKVFSYTEIKTKSFETQLRSSYYTEQHVSVILGHLQVHNFCLF